MAIPLTVKNAAGNWAGNSRLYLPWLPEAERIRPSDSTMTIELDPLEKYATVSYTWAEDGEPQTGRMILCGSEKSGVLTCGWSDSWHQSGEVMAMKGDGMAGGPARVSGTYVGDDGPPWGWRIEFETVDEALVFRMFNITPDGVEEWAVEAIYRRV